MKTSGSPGRQTALLPWLVRGALRRLAYEADRFVNSASDSAGTAKRYSIDPAYRHRRSARDFDDRAFTDEWQREVYAYARLLMERCGLASAYDVGCGSGFKLLRYLSEYHTVGFDVARTVDFLRREYPHRRWEAADFSHRHYPPPDLVICADVIEHVQDPDALLEFIAAMRPRFAVVSTPSRELVYPEGSRYLMGPPKNLCHMREWSFPEFGAYVSKAFHVLDHRVVNERQATQMVLCTSLSQPMLLSAVEIDALADAVSHCTSGQSHA